MGKKVRQSSPQSSFLGAADALEQSARPGLEIEVKQTYMEFPKVVFHSFACPDCGSKVKLMPDGTGRCPKCIVRIPCGIAEVKSEGTQIQP